MKVYNDYLDTIKAAIARDRKSNESIGGLIDHFEKSYSLNVLKDLKSRIPDNSLPSSLQAFARELGKTPNFNQKLGLHPDFANLKGTSEVENHYIISMFVDIKGSTNLFRKYDPETVLIVTKVIQTAAIHTFLMFGGYIHRLQGDGLFIYFGGKGIKEVSEALISSLLSASVFTYFVKNDLKKLLDEHGVDNISTRIGIDLGYDDDVLWAMAGIGEISEVTTCSLHTSLASKMQTNAESNGIVVGDHVKNELPSLNEFFSPVCLRTRDDNDRYIFRIPEEQFNYTQYDFAWLRFLKEQDFIGTDREGNLYLKTKEVIYQSRSIENLAPIAVKSQPYYKGNGW